MTNTEQSDYIKIAEAAQVLGVTQRWVYRRILSGELPASKVGGLYFIARSDLQTLMAAGRVIPEPESSTEKLPPLPQKKCGYCYRLLQDEADAGAKCEKEGCSEWICSSCREAKIHFCARHSPDRETSFQKAQEQKEDGLLPVLVQASSARLTESSFLNRTHQHLRCYSTLLHPSDGSMVLIPSWDAILETGDERIELMRLMGRAVLDSSTIARQPLNAWHHYRLPRKDKKSASLEVHVQVLSRLNRMVQDGFDTQPLTAEDLNLWIGKLVEPVEKNGSFILILLASITGWDPDALRILTGSGGQPGYMHRSALLYLLDLNQNELFYPTADERALPYAELFHPELIRKEMEQIVHAVQNLFGIHDSLALTDAQRSLPYAAEKVRTAFEKMSEDGMYVMSEMKGIGTVLIKRLAL